MNKQLIYPIEEKYQQYLSDESKLVGDAQSISFPENEEEVITIVNQLRGNTKITIQGGKTGISGCAVPLEGHVLNLSNMNKVKEFFKNSSGDVFLKVEPGVTLIELKKAIRRYKNEPELFWPPDPTETSATVGGVASCNSKGITSYLYGESRTYVEAIRVVLADGSVKNINRNESFISFLEEKKDLIDIFLGGEGMFGVITQLTIKLIPKPKELWGICFFFEEKEDLYNFVQMVKNDCFEVDGANLAALEYIDKSTIQLIEERKEVMTKLKELPDVEPEVEAMIYIEIHGEKEEAVEEIAFKLMDYAMQCNSDPEKTWAVSGDVEIEKTRVFRHAAAESANLFIEKIRQTDKRITKLGTDMSFDEENFENVVTKYEQDINNEGLKACIFGHVFSNHLHVNFLPSDYNEYQKGHDLIGKWAKEISLKNGKIITEHGVGKLKKDIFQQTSSKELLEEILQIKSLYDPKNIWNPGNMLSYTIIL